MVKLVDANVHAVVASETVLLPYLSAHWRDYVTSSGVRAPDTAAYAKALPTAARAEPAPAAGPPGSRAEHAARTLFGIWSLDVAVLNCQYGVSAIHNADLAAALAAAVNDWQAEEWLAIDPRFRAAIVVPNQEPEDALRELKRCATRTGFVQALLPVRSETPYGKRRWHRFFEAAAASELPVALCLGGGYGMPTSSSGWPSFISEEHVDVSQAAQSQLMSLVTEGVFERFPRLRVVIVECGFAWLPSLLWRFDKNWKALRNEVPWVKRLPSEYLLEQVWLTTHPLEPATATDLLDTIDMLGSADKLLWGSNYPRYDAPSPQAAFPPGVPDAVRHELLGGNATRLYRL